MHLDVVAACIATDDGRILCVKRGASRFASTAFRWEFPGGKLEPGETPAQAAVREVREELGLAIEVLGDGPTVTHTYPEFSITLRCVLGVVAEDSPPLVLREHLEFAWATPDALWQYDFAAADEPIVCWLRERAFGTHLRTQTFGRYPAFLTQCASTNDELLKWAEAGAPEGALVVTEIQEAGRGRLGRTWLSEPGQGLLFSLLARPKLPAEVAATLPLVAGLAVAETLRRRSIPASLKWPNDVLIGERKVCGILCEAQTSAKGIEGIIVGIGLNVGAVPEAVAYRAIGLAGTPDRLELLAAILRTFEGFYTRWQLGGLAALRQELETLDGKRNQPISVRLSTTPTEGIARGIRDDGALLLETATGLEAILCGEIAQWD